MKGVYHRTGSCGARKVAVYPFHLLNHLLVVAVAASEADAGAGHGNRRGTNMRNKFGGVLQSFLDLLEIINATALERDAMVVAGDSLRCHFIELRFGC